MMWKSLLPLALLLPMSGCGPVVVGSGNAMTETRPLGQIQDVKFSGVGDLTIVFGSTASIEISGDDNIVPLVTTDVSGHTLMLSIRGNVSTKTPLKYKLTLPKLNTVTLSGAGNATVEQWVAKIVECHISGAGNLTLSDCDIQKINGRISGAGTMSIHGTADELNFKLSGAGSLKAEGLETDMTTVEISGAGSAKVWADKELNAKVSGAGSVLYKGNPNVKSKVSGAGTVKALK